MTAPRSIAVLSLFGVLTSSLLTGQRKKKEEEEPIPTQVLEVLPEPPNTAVVETARIGFRTAPLSAKGLLSQQVKDGLKALMSAARGAQIVKVRAFVAGRGDLRSVKNVVAEELSDRKQQMPVITTVRVGGLPLDGAQVQLEGTVLERRPANPHGLAFLSGQLVTSEKPVSRVAGLAGQSIANLKAAAEAAGSSPAGMLRVTCFLSSLEDAGEVGKLIDAAFPQAQSLLTQTQRGPPQSLCECEGVIRLDNPPANKFALLNPSGLTASPNYSQVAIVSTPTVVLSTLQLAFRYTEEDARLAFERLDKLLQASGSSLKQTAMMNTYSLSQQLSDIVRKVRFDFLDKARPPASTMLLFEGLPSMDAAFGIEAVAVPSQP